MSNLLGRKVGVLGGGQLGRMLLEAAFALGLTPVVYCQRADEPAAQLCPNAIIAAFDDASALRKFFQGVEVVAFDSEFVPFEKIAQLVGVLAIKMYPALAVMQQFASKRQQKILLDELKLPTARFEIFKDADRNIASWFQTLAPAFPNGYVLKWGEGGYDGKGVLRSDRADNATQIKFCNEALAKKATVYAEELIPFKRELAIVGVHSRNGDFLTYPLVFSEQDRGICSLVSGPADVDTALEHTAQKLTQTLAKRAGLIGSFALELFETINGALIINEIAPRVHNSGHYSQDACSISQFENHWLALLGLPPQEPVVAAAFVMVNILGREDNAVGVDFPQIPTGFRLHWYGKELGKPRRKLGHLNGWSNAPADRGRLEECAVAWKQSWLKG